MISNSNLSILYIITKLELGGAQKICLSLLEGLQKEQANLFLVSGSGGVLDSQVDKLENVYLLKSFKREVAIKAVYNEIKTFFKLISIIRKIKKQNSNLIVHTHSTKAGLLGRWAAFFAGVKTRVHTVHGYGFNNYQSKIIWSIIYFFELATTFITSHYICVSSADIKTGIKLFPKFKNKCSLIRAAVDFDKFLPAQKIENKIIIFGTVSCFKPQKNLQDLIKAFSYVHANNHNTRLEIIGDGYLKPEIEKS